MKRLSSWIKAACSAAFLGFLVWYVGRQDLASVLRRAHPVFLALCLLLSPILVVASTWKWRIILHREGASLRFAQLFRSYLVGYFFSNFLPSNVGGDVVRSYRAGRAAGDQTLAAASIVVERITGLLGLLALVVAMPWLRRDLASHIALLGPALMALAGIGLIVGLGLVRWSAPTAETPAIGWRARLGSVLTRFAVRSSQAFRTLRRDPVYRVQVALLTVLFYGLALLNVWLAFRAFGANPSLRDLAAVLPTAMFVATMPVALGSLGLAEGSYVFYFGLAGMDPAVTLVMSLLLRVKILVLGAAGGVVYWSDRDQQPAPMKERL
jgi:uncharacterized protein (TIRG00374 family)